jgi:hypothetical protein
MTGARWAGAGAMPLVLLSLWLGAAITVAGVVTPAAFAVLPSRTLAGALVGRVLPTLFWTGVIVGVASALLARGQHHTVARAASGIAMVLACLGAQLVVAPRIERVRRSVGGPIDQLPVDDARRTAFGRLHAASVALLGAAALASAVALVFTMRAIPSGSARH